MIDKENNETRQLLLLLILILLLKSSQAFVLHSLLVSTGFQELHMFTIDVSDIYKCKNTVNDIEFQQQLNRNITTLRIIKICPVSIYSLLLALWKCPFVCPSDCLSLSLLLITLSTTPFSKQRPCIKTQGNASAHTFSLAYVLKMHHIND